jgi:HEAT repeat protein
MSMASAPTGPAERMSQLAAMPDGPTREAAILAALADPSPALRECAIRLASRYVEPAVLGRLVGNDADAVLRNAAIAALERQGPYAVPYLERILQLENGEVVMFAVQVLARIGDPGPATSILPLLRHPDPNVAQSAVEALGRLRSREAVPALLDLLDGNLWLQLAAVGALGEIGDPAAVAPLLALVPDSLVAEPAVRALQQIAAPEALVPLLERLLDGREPALRDSVLQAVGVVLELHPNPVPEAARFGAEVMAGAHSEDLLGYLRHILEAPEALQDEGLVRAAAVLLVAGGLIPLLPTLLRRPATFQEAAWMRAVFGRYGQSVNGELDRLLAHHDPQVRRGALLTAPLGPQNLPQIRAQLQQPDAALRAAACFALGAVGTADAVPVLIDHLCGGQPAEQAAAVAALTRMPGEHLGELTLCLAAGVADPIRLLALEVLEKAPHPTFEPKVVALCADPEPAVRLAALRAVAKLGGVRADVALIRALGDQVERIRAEVLDLLVRRDGQKVVATLAALLGAADSLRYHVIRALGQLRAADAAPKLRALYPDCVLHERIEIVGALARIGGKENRQFLGERLRDQEVELRRIAAARLAEAATPADLPLILEFAQDADWAMRSAAAECLGRLGRPETRDVLLTLVRDVEPVVATVARGAMERMRQLDQRGVA